VPLEQHRLLPDIFEIVGNAARSIGTRRFGVPRLPAEHRPRKLPGAALEEHWRFIRAEFNASAAMHRNGPMTLPRQRSGRCWPVAAPSTRRLPHGS
jgi:hypothetical protein